MANENGTNKQQERNCNENVPSDSAVEQKMHLVSEHPMADVSFYLMDHT